MTSKLAKNVFLPHKKLLFTASKLIVGDNIKVSSVPLEQFFGKKLSRKN